MGYLFFAPTFLMGPLQKPSDYRNPTTFLPLAQCLPLLGRALWGALKLLVISANLAPYALDFDKVTWFGLPYANLLASLCLYSIYLYANFSGAIDIVIAVSAFMGWLLPENFRRPFLSQNINEFWKRWHISLTDLIRAYVFKPFVTRFPSEKGTWKRFFISCCGIVLAFVLSALWHGFSLMFLLWGLWHALGMIIHAIYQKLRPNAKPKSFLIPFQVAGTFLFVSIGWLFFTYPTVGIVGKAVHYGDFSAVVREASLSSNQPTLLVGYWGPPGSSVKGQYSVGTGVKGEVETTPVDGGGFLEIPMLDYSSIGKEEVSISLEFFDESGGKLYGYTAIADDTR
jgi:D-alanyl-lipoteichoic acid acyltransferase DltB (MBOAT superfamily)